MPAEQEWNYGADATEDCVTGRLLASYGGGTGVRQRGTARFKKVIDTATERGFDKILMDFLAVTGELSAIDLYEVAKTMAEYCASKSIYPRVAVVGKPPTVTGFGAQVASNRGLTSMTFSESQPALNWLRVVGSKSPGS